MNLLIMVFGVGVSLDGFLNVIIFHKYQKWGRGPRLFQLGRITRGVMGVLLAIVGLVN